MYPNLASVEHSAAPTAAPTLTAGETLYTLDGFLGVEPTTLGNAGLNVDDLVLVSGTLSGNAFGGGTVGRTIASYYTALRIS